MRRLLLPTLLAAALLPAAVASADTVRAGAHAALLEGTPRADVLAGGKGADAVQAAFGGIDRVRCGPGRDVVDADLGDRVAGDCEVVARRLSVDASTSKASQHETAVEPDSFSSGSTVVAAFQLGRFEHGAAASIGTAVSTDAGRTWRRTVLPALTVESRPAGTNLRASDPSVAYDPVHGVWLVGTLALDDSASHVTVSRSADGMHWAAPLTVATGPTLDKDWLACDGGAASAHRGRCYATYTDDLRGATVVQHSDDGGLTWSDPVRASAMLVGTQPAILPDGRLVVVAGDYAGAAGLTGTIESLVSADGGETFARARIATLKARSGAPLRAIALPSVDVDPAGRVYAVWHDCGLRPDCGGNDLVLATSTDGLTWTAPTAIRLAPGGASVTAFLPGLAADPTLAGHLGLVFAEFLPGTCPRACRVGVAFVSSSDGGLTWNAPQRLSTQPVRPEWLARSEGGRMLGDYFSTSYAAGRFVPVFTLATSPLRGRLREAVFGASLPAAAGPRR